MISIIIPTLNEASVIERTLTSLRAILSTTPYEIIVSDGKSSDATADIARKYADQVVVYSGSTRQNIAMGRNDGAKVAKGDFLLFLDADCWIEHGDTFFSEALSVFEKNPDMVAMTVWLKVGKATETFADWFIFGIVNLLLRFQNNVLHRGESPGEFQMIRRSAFLKLGGFREDLVTREDADMFLRLSKIGRTYFNPHLTVFHTGRRAHKIGWFKLLSIWISNIIYVNIFNKALTKEWKPIR